MQLYGDIKERGVLVGADRGRTMVRRDVSGVRSAPVLDLTACQLGNDGQ
jgi:hypothetical protein